MERAVEDYRNVKDELYLEEDDKFFKHDNVMEDIVKQEDEHIANPYIDFSLMKVMHLDCEAAKYME